MFYLYKQIETSETLIATSSSFDKLFEYQKSIEMGSIVSGKSYKFVIKNTGEDINKNRLKYSCCEELLPIWPTEVNPDYKELSYCIEFPLCVWGTFEEINKVFGSELSEESDDYLSAYGYYNPSTKDVYLMGYTARYNGTNSEIVRVILTDDEKKAFVNIFEDICKENEGITCIEFMLKEAIEMLNLEFKEEK